MIGAIRDVTGDREAERALREAAELYRTLFENAVNPTYQIAGDGRFLDANGAGVRFLETSRPQLLRRSVGDVWGKVGHGCRREQRPRPEPPRRWSSSWKADGGVKALTLTLVPCRYRGATTCFALGTDITDHRTLRTALEESEASLRQQAAALSDSNTALRVILDQRNRDRAELERTITDNVETMILPMLGRLAKPLATTPQAVYLDAAMQGLREVVSPLAQMSPAADAGAQLTPREREIAGLIRVGRSTSEIAEALYISPSTVSFHRKNLRRKLGLAPRGPRSGVVPRWAPRLTGVGRPRARVRPASAKDVRRPDAGRWTGRRLSPARAWRHAASCVRQLRRPTAQLRTSRCRRRPR